MANANQQNKPKRRLKDAETFREKALKAAEEQAKPKHRWTIKAPFIALLRPFRSALAQLRSIKQLKPVFKVLTFIGRIIFPKYLRTSFSELKKVSWPSFKQSRKLTYAVLIFAIIFGASVALVDWGLGKVFKHLLLK